MNRHFSQAMLTLSLVFVFGLVSLGQEPVQPAKPSATTPTSGEAPNMSAGAALMLTFVGGIDDEGRLITFQMRPATVEEVVKRDVTVNGKKLTLAIKRPRTVLDRVRSPVPLKDVSVTNLKGEQLSEDEIRKALSKDTLILQSFGKDVPLTPLQIERVKPETLIFSMVIKPMPVQVGAESPAVPNQAATEAPGPAPIDRERFPISPSPGLKYVTDLNSKGEFNVVEAFPMIVLRTDKETVKDEQGQTQVVEKQVEEERMETVVRKSKLGEAPIMLLKEAAVKAGKHGDEISIEEAQRRIGKGAVVLVSDRRLPDPRYLTVFRGDTLILNQAPERGYGYSFIESGDSDQPAFPIDDYLTQLKDADAAVRQEAANNLYFIIYDRKATELIRKATPALAAAMKDEDPNVRRASVAAMRQFGPWAKAAVPALAEAIKDEVLAHVAHQALRRIGPEATAVVPVLAELLQGESDADRVMAADTLLSIAPDKAKAAIPKLREFLKTEESELRNHAATVLAKIAPDQAQAALPILLEQLKAENNDFDTLSESRIQAIRALGLVAPHVGKELVPSLIELIGVLGDPNNLYYQVQVSTILVQLDPDKAEVAVPILANALYANSDITPQSAAAALMPLTPELADECRDALLADLQSASHEFPVQHMLTPDRGMLGTIQLLRGNPDQITEAQQAIVSALKRVSAPERFQTLTEWGRSPLASQELFPIVREFTQDTDEIIKSAANTALASITKAKPNAGTASPTASPKTAAEPPPKPDPKKAREFREQADAHLRRGKLNEAIAAMQQAIRFDPQNASFGYVLAYMQHRAGQVDDAQSTVQIAKELERKQRLSNWGQLMEPYQGSSRAWLEKTRRE